jgi:hypothetical protein
MNHKMGFALLAIGLITSLGIVACDCINLHVIDRNNAPIEGSRVYVEAAANHPGDTNASGYLFIPLDPNAPYIKDHTIINDNVWNITVDWKNKIGWATVTVPSGTCQNVTISMLY